MSLPAFSVRQAVLVNILFFVCLFAGLGAYLRTPVDFFPEIGFNVTLINTVWNGASADEVERLVTARIEDELGEIEGVKEIRSTSRANSSTISVEFDENLSESDYRAGVNDVRAAVDRVPNLPDDAEEPIVRELSTKSVYSDMRVAVVDSGGYVVVRQVLQPLNMSDTGQYLFGMNLDKRATGYEVSIDGYRTAAPIYKPFFAAGSMYATVDDLVQYDHALYGNDVITEGNIRMLFESREAAVDGTFAYGWNVGELTLDGAIESRRYMATNGEINGFNAVMVRLPDDKHLAILLNNTGETDLFAIATNIIRVLYDLAPIDPAPRLRDVFYRKLQEDSLEVAIAFYREQRENSPRDYIFFHWPMRILAGQLIRGGRYDDAIALLLLNLETNPNDARSFVILAQAQMHAGQVTAAIDSFRTVLLLDEGNTFAADMLQRLNQ